MGDFTNKKSYKEIPGRNFLPALKKYIHVYISWRRMMLRKKNLTPLKKIHWGENSISRVSRKKILT